MFQTQNFEKKILIFNGDFSSLRERERELELESLFLGQNI
jgi:hypothetical protein